jgi:methionine synthase II (cobalamin-independent)
MESGDAQYANEFLDRVGGFSKVWQYRHQGETKYHNVVVHRMQPRDTVFYADAIFLVRNTNRVTKFALPSPFLIATRYWNKKYSQDAYATRFDFMQHLEEILAIEARGLEEAGIDIVQLDDPAITYSSVMKTCSRARRMVTGYASHGILTGKYPKRLSAST